MQQKIQYCKPIPTILHLFGFRFITLSLQLIAIQTIKRHCYNDQPLYTPIFVAVPFDRLNSNRVIIIFLRFTANLVGESTVTHSSFVPKIEAIKLHICIFYSNLCKVCEKKLKPLYGIRRKKQRNHNKTLNTHILQMAVANLIKFAV